jgi:ankyrin repeat protein
VGKEDRDLAALQAVLQRINSSLDDFASQPARSASDKGAFGDSPLHKVAIWGDREAAEVLLAHGADLNAAGEDGDTPLHRAVAGGHAEMVKFLLIRGADPNLTNRYGSSALKDAEDTGKPDVIGAMRWSIRRSSRR